MQEKIKTTPNSNKMSLTTKRVVLSLMENLKNSQKRGNFQQALATYDSTPEDSLRKLREDPECKAMIDDHLAEFFSWEESFKMVVKETGKQQQIGNFNIIDKLITLQPKIKVKSPHNSYILPLMDFIKKQLKLDQDFIAKWRDKKIQVKQLKLKHNQKSKQMKAQQQQQLQKKIQAQKANTSSIVQKIVPLAQPIPQRSTQPIVKTEASFEEVVVPPPAAISKQKEEALKIQREKQRKKIVQKKTQIDNLKHSYQTKFIKNRENRQRSLVNYLEGRKQFNFKDGVVKQILNNLQRFMKQKIAQIIRVTKLRAPGYDSEEAGDQFKVYSSRSNVITTKHTAMLPESDIKFLKIRYPSKIQRYLKLRCQQQAVESAYKNDLQNMQGDKKSSDKMIINYVTAQQNSIHTFQIDEGSKKRDRLIVAPQVIQYVIENDPWFGDLLAMERTFYRALS